MATIAIDKQPFGCKLPDDQLYSDDQIIIVAPSFIHQPYIYIWAIQLVGSLNSWFNKLS